MSLIEVIFQNYMLDNGVIPSSSENYLLVQTFSGKSLEGKSYFTPNSRVLNANQEFIDGWGTPLRIRIESKDKIVITSAGPDKVFGTPDDISNQ